jgi:hypothetical protein
MDIVEKLRFYVIGDSDINAAADEIERLREVLQKIADMQNQPIADEHLWVVLATTVKLARKALGEKE